MNVRKGAHGRPFRLPVQEFYYVAVLDYIFFTLGADEALLARFGKTSCFEQLLPVAHLRTNKFVAEVGVYRRPRHRCRAATYGSPRAGLVFACGKKADKPQELVA